MQKQRYGVSPGLTWVAGQPVPKGRVVELTDAEALYDLALDRIRPIAGRKQEAADADGSADGRD